MNGKNDKQGELFDLPPTNEDGLVLGVPTPASRRSDPETSKAAAAEIEKTVSKKQRQVLEAFLELGPMTARQAERLDRFNHYGFSTVRKRISELAKKGLLVSAGTDREGGRTPATIYKASEGATEQ